MLIWNYFTLKKLIPQHWLIQNFPLVITRALFGCVSMICRDQLLEVNFSIFICICPSKYCFYVCYLYVYIYMYMCVCMCVCLCMYVYVCMSTCVYMSMCLCICLYVYLYVCIHVLIYVCLLVSRCIYVWMCIFCVCLYLCLFELLLVSIYERQHKCLGKVNEISVCIFLYRLLPLGLALLFG